jgi:hypothetical protein
MIIYDLTYRHGHRFEGWFRDAADFDAQCGRELVSCPQCGNQDVRRIPSAVAIGTHGGGAEPRQSTSPNAQRETFAMHNGSELLAAYRQLVSMMREHSEDVGDAFVEEARRIHYCEAPERAIRGNATPDECAELEEEGISIVRLPIIKGEDLD